MHMICRKEEQKILTEFLRSDNAELLAVYGRRRVGKTFLIMEFFADKPVIFFNVTGSKEGTLPEQIRHFTKMIGDTFYNGAVLKERKSWDGTFELLTDAIQTLWHLRNKKVVLFFDEFPWMATHKSRLLETLDYYWNQYWVRDKRIKLIVCGSSASWIINKIINNKGGLHNRITRKILLEPFNLLNTKLFLLARGIKLNNNQITQLYMVTGGVPYYLVNIKKGLSALQNITQLAFKKNAMLLGEFDNLFASLFNGHEMHIEIIRAIAYRRYGMEQKELFKHIGKKKGKDYITRLKELEDAGFIMSFTPYQRKKKGVYYRVIDEYTLFYLKWIEPIKNSLLKSNLPDGYWAKQQHSPSWYSWSGLAFESICYKNLSQISRALELGPGALPNTWRCSEAQIDLLFDRDDNAITLCEIKFTDKKFVVDKQCAVNLVSKKDIFIKRTKTEKQVFIAMVASNGVAKSSHADELVDGVVTLEDLFTNDA